jgi:hypothetical protein
LHGLKLFAGPVMGRTFAYSNCRLSSGLSLLFYV